MDLVVLVGGDVEERAALLAGIARRSGVRADQERLAVRDRLVNGLEDVGEDRADDEIDLVAFEQALDLAHGAVRLEFIVDDDEFDVLAGHLAAEVLDRERKAVADLRAERRGGARQGHDHADLDLLLRRGLAGGDAQQDRKSGQFQRLHHDNSLTRPNRRNHAHVL